MELNAKIQSLENEINLLKLEVKQVLVDLRDALLQSENPFSPKPIAAPGPSERHADGGIEGDASERPLPSSAEGTRPLSDPDPEGEEGAPALTATRSSSGAAAMPEPALTSAASEQRGIAAAPLFGGADSLAGSGHATAMPWHQRNGSHPPATWTAAAAQTLEKQPEGWGMLTVASMAKWVDSALRQVGRERFETIIEIFELTSGSQVLTPGAKQALLRMAQLSDAGNEKPACTMNDSIALLTQLDALLRTNGRSESTVLSLLTEMNLL